MTSPYRDLAAYTALPRLTGLALSIDGTRLVASVQAPDEKKARYTSSLWEIPLGAGEPQRLTGSAQGESSPAFTPDGTLLFTSARPDDQGSEDDAALWALPTSGESTVRARRPGGLSGPVVAVGTGAVVLAGSRLVASTDAEDAERRATRQERKITAILHTGMPIRYWDHELGYESARLLVIRPDTDAPVDLAPDATIELEQASYSVTADASTVAVTWVERQAHGRSPSAVMLIDVASGRRTMLTDDDGWELAGPKISPDGRHVAVSREPEATFEQPVAHGLAVHATDGGAVPVELGDLWPTEWVWSRDSSTLYVSGDLHGRGAVLAVDPATGGVRRRLASDAVYESLCTGPHAGALFALRSAMDRAARPVRLDTAAEDQTPQELPTPAATPTLPGSLEEINVEVGGETVHAWLFLPPAGDGPAPVMQWIHGGPFASYNAWSWRWNPWVAVAHGWAVILPDPALSTGYGPGCIARAWPYRADVVWHEVEVVLDHVLERLDAHPGRVALLGASFGGFMTNWIAGHTDRFAAIVTHAGLWALDQQHATTDAAAYKTSIFGTLTEHPEWYTQYSPHNALDAIATPMLISHGNRDYRVPVSEALRQWWDLVAKWDGDPADMPHRFLQLTGENHWVLSPANAEIWYDTVLGFCAEHVLGVTWTPSTLL